MNTEEQILAILLNRPNDKNLININANWFTKINYKWLFEAIRNSDQAQLDSLVVYGLVKTQHPNFSMRPREIEEIKQSYIHDAALEILAVKLHKHYLSSLLRQQMQMYMQAPIDENADAVKETMGIMDNLQVIQDSGEMDTALDNLVSKLGKPQPAGIQTYAQLDKLLGDGLYGGMLMTIGARPSVGKTALAVNLAFEIEKHDPSIHVDYFTIEMSKRAMVSRFISLETGINSNYLRNPYRLPERTKTLIKTSVDNYRHRHIRIYDRTPNLNDILKTIRRNASKAPANKYVAIVDYIGLVNVPGNADRYVKVGEITRQLKIATNEYNIPIIELSQLNRGVTTRQDKTPVLSDLRESGSVEQDSNVVALLYVPDEQTPDIKCLAIKKNRDGELGDIYMGFDGSKMLFQPVTYQSSGQHA